MADESDELGCPEGSPYPQRKPRPPCRVCGVRPAKRKGAGWQPCTPCHRAQPAQQVARKKWQHNSPTRKRDKSRFAARGVGASVSEQEWVAIWRSQAGLCLICLHPLKNRWDAAEQPGTRIAALDHDHEVESRLKKAGVSDAAALRQSICGLLCGFPCNRLLVRHWSSERLVNAARYRATMPAQEVLRHGTST